MNASDPHLKDSHFRCEGLAKEPFGHDGTETIVTAKDIPETGDEGTHLVMIGARGPA